MAGTDSDAVAVKNCRRIVGMDAVYHEGDDAGLFFRVRTADNADVRNLLHPLQGPDD